MRTEVMADWFGRAHLPKSGKDSAMFGLLNNVLEMTAEFGEKRMAGWVIADGLDGGRDDDKDVDDEVVGADEGEDGRLTEVSTNMLLESDKGRLFDGWLMIDRSSGSRREPRMILCCWFRSAALASWESTLGGTARIRDRMEKGKIVSQIISHYWQRVSVIRQLTGVAEFLPVWMRIRVVDYEIYCGADGISPRKPFLKRRSKVEDSMMQTEVGSKQHKSKGLLTI
ncbi:hypothetical protein BY996DRAFT_6562254 [Phakopsora pachyrhizi]|nr:hypothetical protein BY996DRAFT_6562254 [Phakopsora pachyrhizi]